MQSKKKDIKPLIFGVFGGVAVLFLFPAIVLTIITVCVAIFIALYCIFPMFRLKVNNKVKNIFKKKVAK